MKISKLILVLIYCCIYATSIFAQDVIQKKDGTKINAKIIEIGKSEIKYRIYDEPDSPIIVVDKYEITSIKIAGKKDNTIVFKENPMSVSDDKILGKTKAIKFHMFSLSKGYLGLSQEWVQKPGFNWEVGIGIIGAGYYGKKSTGYPPVSKLGGFYVTGGPKFLFGNSNDVVEEGKHYKYAHPLKGRYFKIEGFVNTFDRTTTYTPSYYGFYNPGGISTANNDIKIRYTSCGLNFIYGRQLIIGNMITLGYYIGLGYGIESRTILKKPDSYDGTAYDIRPNRYGHYSFGNTPLISTCGVTIGYMYEKWPWQSNKLRKERSKQPSRNSMGG